MSYYFSKTLNIPFDQAVIKTIDSLQQAGFGILIEIDVQVPTQKKLNVTMLGCKVLGACNPAFAYQSFQIGDKIGTMLPFNVIVQQIEAGVIITAIDPIATMQPIENSTLKEISERVKIKLKSAIDYLEK